MKRLRRRVAGDYTLPQAACARRNSRRQKREWPQKCTKRHKKKAKSGVQFKLSCLVLLFVSLCAFLWPLLFLFSFPDGGFVLEFCDQIVELVAGSIAVGAQFLFFLRDFREPVFLLVERGNEPLAEFLLAGAVAECAEVLPNPLLLRVDLVPLAFELTELLLDAADRLPLRERLLQRLLGGLVEVLLGDPRRELLIRDVGEAPRLIKRLLLLKEKLRRGVGGEDEAELLVVFSCFGWYFGIDVSV